MSTRIRFSAGPAQLSGFQRWTAHPLFAWAGLRPVQAQHTKAEHDALQRYARGRRSIVEIGVAEGASAAAIREVMDPSGTLYLVDPYHLSRVPPLNFLRRAAHRVVAAAKGAGVVWIEKFSHEAAGAWTMPIDFLFIDGDHEENAVAQDWAQWSRFLLPDGVAAFHDARVFPGGWTWPDYGPVKFVDRTFRAGRGEWAVCAEVDSLVFVARAGVAEKGT